MQKIAIMVGSVYGGAEYVAEQAGELLSKKGYQARWFQPPELDAVQAFAADCWLVITSTTGQGDIPDNLFPFYADCRGLLTDEGCMTVNLFGRDASYERSLQSICAVFGEDAVWAFKPTREGNTIVLAQRTADRPTRMALLARAEEIQSRWRLPAVKWLKIFKPAH